MKLSSILALAACVPAAWSAETQIRNALGQPSYGVDVSFPVHYETLVDGPLGDRRTLYDDFMTGCREHYSRRPRACDVTEEGRLEMSVRQPQSMQVRRHER